MRTLTAARRSARFPFEREFVERSLVRDEKNIGRKIQAREQI